MKDNRRVCRHASLSPSSTIWYRRCGASWEGNRRSGVALATCHREHYGLTTLEREKTPYLRSYGVQHSLRLEFTCNLLPTTCDVKLRKHKHTCSTQSHAYVYRGRGENRALISCRVPLVQVHVCLLPIIMYGLEACLLKKTNSRFCRI